MLTRRQFLKYSLLAGAGLAVPARFLSNPGQAFAYSDSQQLRKFVEHLRIVGQDIPIAQADVNKQSWWQKGVTHYSIDVGQYEDLLHPDLPNPTRLRGFGQGGNYKHLGGVIAAKRGEPVQITFRNKLPLDHILPIDRTIMGAEKKSLDNRTDVHLHGGFVPWISDGVPHSWWTPNGKRGETFQSEFLNPTQAQNEAEYYWPNQQGSRLMWFHDHTFGLTRLNAYAGVATGYVIYDDYELSMVAKNNLPGPLDPRTVYLVFQDKIFVRNDIETTDPTWMNLVKGTRPGDLWYAHEYEPDRWEVSGGTPPAVSVIPEFFGDTILVNGAVYPYLEVEPRQYRFRMLNACNARFLNPRLVYAKGQDFPNNAEPNLKMKGPGFIQIGTEGGFLPKPVIVSSTSTRNLLLAPAERADLIVDFRDVAPGSILILYSDAPAPFPMGDEDNDDFPGNPLTPQSVPGYGPNTRTLLQIKVKARSGKADAPILLPSPMTPTDPFLVKQNSGVPTDLPAGVPVRYLTLNEDFDGNGRLIQMLGTNDLPGGAVSPQFGREYMSDPSEVIAKGSTEVWEIINLTGDTHPIHFHLTNAQILSRQPFNGDTYQGGIPDYTGKAYAPDANELGWKETLRMNPGEVTRVIMKFDLPSVPFEVPESSRTGGYEYVWHCHILEHEEHDMMRPLVII